MQYVVVSFAGEQNPTWKHVIGLARAIKSHGAIAVGQAMPLAELAAKERAIVGCETQEKVALLVAEACAAGFEAKPYRGVQ